MKENTIQTMDLSMMDSNGRALVMNDTLLVNDNLAMPFKISDYLMERYSKRFPLKITTTCMVIVYKGSVTFTVNFRDYVAAENTCIIITEGTIVEKVVYVDDARVMILSYSQNGLLSPFSKNQRNLNRLYALQVMLVHLQPSHLEMMKTVYEMLRTILSDPSFAPNREATANNCLNLMANILMQNSESQQELGAKTTRRDEIVARFLRCVADNYREHRELSFYAAQLGLSLKYMSHIVHEQTGRHPSQWIKDYVILDAKTMLRSTRYTVQQVAEELNFPNQSFFGKYFKEAVGVSPKKWN